ncbi:hypothetical protein HPB49_006349 [Dermacentor silvarum]|uniref:Uncharacterized protein n=1 Tax=Dermacentor silvarum TaxID=543639 RepID=A0ACB8DWA6_DERSI|nr:hypothetical protein HPB49_006349 [Dermacentor silvarum]
MVPAHLDDNRLTLAATDVSVVTMRRHQICKQFATAVFSCERTVLISILFNGEQVSSPSTLSWVPTVIRMEKRSVPKVTVSSAVFLCLVVIAAFVLMLMLKVPAYAARKEHACSTGGCLEHARRLLSTLNASVDPCQDLPTYVSSGDDPAASRDDALDRFYDSKSESEEVTARMQAEGNTMKVTIEQLEKTKPTLTAEMSQFNRCIRLNIRPSGLENELQLPKTTIAKLESRLSSQESHSETLQQLADKDQPITAHEEKSAAYNAINQELLKSNAELTAALRSSEVEKVAQAERMHEVVAENSWWKHQDAMSHQNSKGLALDTALGNLEVKLTEVLGTSKSLSSQLSASAEQCAKLEEVIATRRSELEASRCRCGELETLSQAGCKKEAHSTQLLEVQDELNRVTWRADQIQAGAKKLEASKQQLDTLCSELRHKLSESEHQLNVAAEENGLLFKTRENVPAAQASLSAQFDKTSKQHATLIAPLQHQVQESEVRVFRLKEQKQTLTEKSGKLQAEFELLGSEQLKLHEKNAVLANELSEGPHFREELNYNLVSQNRQVEKLTAECVRLEQCIENSTAEKAELEVHLEKEAEVVHALEETCAEHVALNENLFSENATAKSTLEEAKLKTEHLEASIKWVNDENFVLRRNLVETRQKLDTVQAEKQTLQLKLSYKSATCNALQEYWFISDRRQKLLVSKSLLGKATRRIGSLQEKICFFQQPVTRLNLEKESLHSSLATAEATSQSLEKKGQTATCAAEEMRLKLKKNRHRQMQLSSLIELQKKKCRSLEMVTADMSEKLSCREHDLASAASERDKTVSAGDGRGRWGCMTARLWNVK